MASEAGAKPQKEMNRLKAQMKHLEKDKEKQLPNLGHATYQAFLEGRLTDVGLIEMCEKLRALDNEASQARAQIAELQAQLQQMKAGLAPAGVPCPSCGASVASGIRFCGNCGSQVAIQAPQPAQAPTAGTCPACGIPVVPGARFCGECGATIGQPTTPAPQPQVMAPAPPPPQTQAATPAPPPPPMEEPAAPAEPQAVPEASAPPPPAAPPAAPESQAPPRCPSCGTPIDEGDAAFCGECGARLK
jgi:membrane protease subunit (stomatin/prohibitin family)